MIALVYTHPGGLVQSLRVTLMYICSLDKGTDWQCHALNVYFRRYEDSAPDDDSNDDADGIKQSETLLQRNLRL